MTMTLDQVRNMIRHALDDNGNVPTRKKLRHHVLFRHKSLGTYGFSLQWEDVVRLDRDPESCWLICGDSADTQFDFFVVPHSEGRQLIGNLPLLCRPAGNGTRFRTATQNVNFNPARCALTAAPRRELGIFGYKNRIDLYEQLVLKHWGLVKVRDPTELFTKVCPACHLDRLPDYRTETHDFQCRNGACHLLWCGDYWLDLNANSQVAIRDRKAIGQPCARGFWKFCTVSGNWKRWP